MSSTIVFLLLSLGVGLNWARSSSEYPLATECQPQKCRLPDCRCSDYDLPIEEFHGQEEKIPQFITLTFDDALNSLNFPPIAEIFEGLRNSDNCSAHGTFFVSHEYSDYSKINELYIKGHEIALHSVSHSTEKDYWRDADVDTLVSEFGDQIDMLEQFAYIKRNHLRGMRLPFLQTSGNNSFIAAKKIGLLYDSSLPTTEFREPPLWPYTLDYHTVQECHIDNCPTASIPGLWVNPMVAWEDMKGFKCAMVDACFHLPNDEVDDIVDWMMQNFLRHYETNHAPFGMYLHAMLFDRTHNFVKGFRKFLEEAIALPNVYVVTVSQVIEYMQDPILGVPYKTCPKNPKTKKCFPKICPLLMESTKETRYMTVCGSCPGVYPWLGNPLGIKKESTADDNILSDDNKKEATKRRKTKKQKAQVEDSDEDYDDSVEVPRRGKSKSKRRQEEKKKEEPKRRTITRRAWKRRLVKTADDDDDDEASS